MSQISSFQKLEHWLQQQVIGQPTLVNRLLVALLADGHLLVEGAPGLAKTRAIHVLGQHLESDYQRIQFTPDLLPADITGTDIFSQQEGKFHFQPGPLFHNLILADEINRAPAKVQSALLEAMAERQVTVAGVTRRLPEPFLVMATQNPIEQEGTYPLPEAQLDRFLLHVFVDYPEREHEKQILHLVRGEVRQQLADETPAERGIVSQMDIRLARQQVVDTYLSQPIEDYLIQLVLATRKPQSYGEEPLRSEWAGDYERDQYEIALTEECLRRDKPILGVCQHQVNLTKSRRTRACSVTAHANHGAQAID